jgi:hypothetical protein
MKFEELTGKKLAILAVGNDDKEETEAAVFTGIARWSNGHLFLDRDCNQKPFQIPDDTLERIKSVPEKVSDIFLGAEFYIPMSIGPLPKDANPEDYTQTGLKWPE